MQKNITRLTGQQTLVALAMTVALTMPVPASADNENFTLYGQANVSYDMVNTGAITGQNTTAGISSNRVSSNSSRIGVKGSSDLGSGWAVMFQVEETVGTDTGASGGEVYGNTSKSARLFDRNTYLGVAKADVGRLLLGRYDTPYKLSTRSLDVFADGIADNRSLMGTTMPGGAGGTVTETFDVRQSNLIAYFSPKFAGFSGALGYANLTEHNSDPSQPSSASFSLAVLYQEDQAFASFAYEVHSTTVYSTTEKGDKLTGVKAAKLGLGYKLDILSLGFAYEKSLDDYGNIDPYDAVANPCGGMSAGANCSGHDTVYVSAKLNFTAADALKLAYSKTGQVGTAKTDTGAHQFSVGIDHDFNERTSMYFLYTLLKNDRLVSYHLSSAATSGADSVNTSGTGGAAPSAFSLGVRHSF